MRPSTLALVILVAALAGCIGQDASPEGADPGDPAPAVPDNGSTEDPDGTSTADRNRTAASNVSIPVDLVWATDTGLVRWNHQTGNRTRIEVGDAAGSQFEVTSIRWGPDGQLYATTMTPNPGPGGTGSAAGTPPAVLRVDPASGEAETVHTGPPLATPLALTVLEDGRILVADRGETAFPPAGAPSPSGQIVEIAPDGNAAVLTADPRFHGWLGLAAIDGQVYLTTQTDQQFLAPTDPGGVGALWRIDPSTGSHELVSSSSLLESPSGITAGPEGGLYLSEWDGQRVLEVDPSSGQAAVVHPVNGSQNLWGLDTLPDGRIVVSGQGGLWVVDPATGTVRQLVATTEDGGPRHVRAVVGP